MPNHAVIGVICRRGRGRNSIEVTSLRYRLPNVVAYIDPRGHRDAPLGENGKKGTDLHHRQKRELQVVASV